ncbi:TPA: hypothetical protein ACX6RB_002405 [Photobacterium damselae]
MPEPITTVGIGAIAAYLGKDGLQKLLGPTADDLGTGLRDFTQKRVENVGRIFQTAETKLGDKKDADGSVPPKVLKTIINDGSYNDDSVAVEYFGGVLASSKTELGRDDRGARMAKIVDDLSTYQLRTHFLIYATIRQLFKEKGFIFNMDDRDKMEIFIPYSFYTGAMDFTQEELNKGETLVRHTFFGLANDGLIENNFQYGSKESINRRFAKAEYDGIICQPSALGAELFLWAFGQGDKALNYIFDSSFNPLIEGLSPVIQNTVAAKEI